MLKRITGILAALAATALALSSCAAGASTPKASGSQNPDTEVSNPGSADRPVTIGLTYIPNVQFAPFYVATEQKLFKWDAAGGNNPVSQPVNLRHHGADEGLFSALLSGKEDFVVAFGDEAIQAVSQGMELTTIGILYQRYPVVVIAKKDSGIAAWSDLKGKTVGIPGKYGSSWFGFQAGLSAAGLTLADVNVAEIGYTQQTQLATGKVDAVVGFSNNDLVQFELAGLDVTALSLPADIPLVGAAIVTTPQWVENAPETCRGIVNGMAAAVNIIGKDPKTALAETRKYDETLTNEPALASARKVLAATSKLEELENFDPHNPGKSSLPHVKQFRDMIALLDRIGALGKKRNLTELDDAGLARYVWSGKAS